MAANNGRPTKNQITMTTRDIGPAQMSSSRTNAEWRHCI